MTFEHAFPYPPAAGEHYIGYAYPSSEVATFLGLAHLGCHYLLTPGNNVTACVDYPAALALVRGTSPGRWSMDHPLNQRFLDPGTTSA